MKGEALEVRPLLSMPDSRVHLLTHPWPLPDMTCSGAEPLHKHETEVCRCIVSQDHLPHFVYVCMYVYVHVYLHLSFCYSQPHPLFSLSSVAFSDDSEHHVSDEEGLPQELKDIVRKEKQKKEKEEEGAFPQGTLERRKKVQERKSLLSPKMSRRSEQLASPSNTQASPKDDSEEVKQLKARVKELELVSALEHPHTHAHAAEQAARHV